MKTTALLIICAFAAGAYADPTIQGSPEEVQKYLNQKQRTVTLSGQASTILEADQIKAYVQIRTEGSTISQAIERNEEAKKRFLDAVTKQDIPRGQIKMPKYATLTPRYSQSGDREIGQIAASRLTLDLSSQQQYVNLLSVIDQVKESSFDGLSYDHPQLKNIHREILKLACKRVMERRDAYQEGLGITLTPVSIIEGEGSQRPGKDDATRYGQIPVTANIQVVFSVTAAPATAEAPKTKPVVTGSMD